MAEDGAAWRGFFSPKNKKTKKKSDQVQVGLQSRSKPGDLSSVSSVEGFGGFFVISFSPLS